MPIGQFADASRLRGRVPLDAGEELRLEAAVLLGS